MTTRITTDNIADGTIENIDIKNGDIDITSKITGTLPVSKGGTGLTSLGSAGQAIKVNSGGSGLEFGSAGGILQVVSATKTDTFTLSSSDGTFTDVTGLSVSITPTSTSSKIFIMANLNISGSNRYAAFKVLRDSTSIGIGDAASSRTRVAVSSHRNESATNDHHIMHNSSTNFLDSPNTTSATTYKIQIANTYVAGGYTVYVNRGNTDADANYAHRGASTITVMEVSA